MKPYLPNSCVLSAVTLVTALVLTGVSLERSLADTPSPAPSNPSPIPMDQIGAVAGKQYSGDGLSVTPTKDGALLRCVFQVYHGWPTKEKNNGGLDAE